MTNRHPRSRTSMGYSDGRDKGSEMIDRETAIALADLWDSQWPTYPRTPEGIGGMVAVKLCAKELREAVAHLRKDAEPQNGSGFDDIDQDTPW